MTYVFNVHTDHLGSPRKITNQAGTIVWLWAEKPFGDVAANQDPDNDGVAFEYNLRFPGQFFDKETGLYYNYHRYYDSQTGRYITSDPIGLSGGLNTFGYVGGNPVNLFDFDGWASKGSKVLKPEVKPCDADAWATCRYRCGNRKVLACQLVITPKRIMTNYEDGGYLDRLERQVNCECEDCGNDDKQPSADEDILPWLLGMPRMTLPRFLPIRTPIPVLP